VKLSLNGNVSIKDSGNRFTSKTPNPKRANPKLSPFAKEKQQIQPEKRGIVTKKTPLTPTSIPIKLKNNKPQTAPSNDRNKLYDDIVEKLYKEQQAN